MSRGRRGFIVAIDGPAGSGKSTTARRCAQELGLRHLDTGAMYRAVTLKVLETGTDWRSARALRRLLARTRLSIRWHNHGYSVLLDGRDVSQKIRSPEVSALVSAVSAIPAVRQRLVALQRRLARGVGLVCEGRDIGSVVFPDAQLKVYLDCAVEARAARRRRELAENGIKVTRAQVLRNLVSRDRIDSRRATSPLTRVKDAVLVDTTQLTIDEQVQVVCALARQRLNATG